MSLKVINVDTNPLERCNNQHHSKYDREVIQVLKKFQIGDEPKRRLDVTSVTIR